MSEARRIADLYRSVYEGDEKGEAWHGMALKPLLADLTPEQASRPYSGPGHSILQLVLHMAYWEEVTLRRFRGEAVDAPLNTPQDWPENATPTEAEWRAALERLDASHRALRQAIAGCSEQKLTEPVAGKDLRPLRSAAWSDRPLRVSQRAGGADQEGPSALAALLVGGPNYPRSWTFVDTQPGE